PHRALCARGRGAHPNSAGGDRQPLRPLPECVRPEHGRPSMSVRDDIANGRTSLGIELGSTRIKACLIGSDPTEVLATGSFAWENRLEDGLWTYALDDVWQGLQAAFADLASDAEKRHGIRPEAFGAIGISAMMHG